MSAVTRKLSLLEDVLTAMTLANVELAAANEQLTRDTLTLDEAVRSVEELLLTRAGEVVDPDLALERARNIVQALVGQRVGVG